VQATLRRLAGGLGLLLVLGLAWGLRVADAPTIFTDAGIRAAGPDAYYHLRRAADSLERFPAILEHDRYLNHPHGGDVIWPPGLDWTTAAAARVLLGPAPSREAFERFALSLPVGLGLLAVAWAALFAARRFGVAAGLVAGALLAVLPGHVLYTRLGMLDHHALEVPFTLAFLSSAGALWRAAKRSAGATRLRDGGAVAGFAAVAASAFLVWPGLLLQLALVDAVLAGAVFLGEPAPWRRRLAALAAAGHGLAAVALLPWWGREWEYWGDFAPVVLGSFQPWLLACAAAVLGVGAGRGGAAAPARLGAGAAAGLALLAASALAFPDLLAAPGRAWAWLGRGDAFQAQVSESVPLLAGGIRDAARLLSLLAFATPLALAGFVRDRLRRPGPPADEGWLLVAMALGLGAAALAQRRFANAFSVTEALLLGWWLGAALPAWLHARGVARAGRALAGAAAAGIVGVALAPVTAIHGPAFERRAQHARGRPMRLAADVWRRHELHALAEWIRASTPPTSGFHDPSVAPEYGVMAHWTDGHVLEYVARRPTIVTNFGDDLGEENWAAAARYFVAEEPEASAVLDALGARYAILEWRPQPPFDAFEPGSMVARGFFADGSAADASLRGRGAERVEVLGRWPAFERHRLVQESAPKPWAPDQPFFKVYEHVAGARVEGRAPPGAEVAFAVDLATSRGRRFTWRSLARADAAGRYRARLPYATLGAPPAVAVAPSYRVSLDGRERARLPVAEVAVQEGLAVAGPDLSAEAP